MDERLYRQRRWTDEQLINAVQTSVTLSEVGRKLGLKSQSSSNRTLPKHIKRLELDTTHLLGRRASGNRTPERFNQLPLAQILVNDSNTSPKSIKRRLLKNGTWTRLCMRCGIGDWQGKPLTLQIDHINGKRTDNRLENLRLLCPNCHSQTDTYAGKNKRMDYGELRK